MMMFAYTFLQMKVFIQYVSGDSFVPAHVEWLSSQKRFAHQSLILLLLFAVQLSYLVQSSWQEPALDTAAELPSPSSPWHLNQDSNLPPYQRLWPCIWDPGQAFLQLHCWQTAVPRWELPFQWAWVHVTELNIPDILHMLIWGQP